jgi:hypothetical protein
MNVGEKQSRIYQYSMADLFNENAEMTREICLWEKEVEAVQAKPALMTNPTTQICVVYAKNVLKAGCVYSLPAHLLNIALVPAVAEPNQTIVAIVNALSVDAAWEFDDSVALQFFQIVAPRRELQVSLHAAHVSRETAGIRIELLDSVGRSGASYSLRHSTRGSLTVDPRHWCSPDRFIEFARNLIVWRMVPGHLEVDLVGSLTLPPAMPVLRMPAIEDVMPAIEDRRPQLDEDMSLDELRAVGPLPHPSSSSSASPPPQPPALSPVGSPCTDVVHVNPDKKRRLEMVKSLIANRMFVEDDQYAQSLAITGFDSHVAKSLLDCGAIVGRESVFGEMEFAVVPHAIRTTATLLVDTPKLVSRCTVKQASIRHLSKLELLRYLLQSKWIVGDGTPLQRDGPRHFFPTNLLKSKSYWLCMACSEFIFAKPGNLDSISQRAAHLYYECLLQCADLTILQGRGNPLALSEADLKAIKSESLQAAGLLRVADGYVEDDDDCGGGDAPGAGGGIMVALPSCGPAVVLQTDLRMAPMKLSRPGTNSLTVYFDNYTHQSGRLRAFVYCKAHDNCRLYRFLDQFGNDKTECSAFLIG